MGQGRGKPVALGTKRKLGVGQWGIKTKLGGEHYSEAAPSGPLCHVMTSAGWPVTDGASPICHNPKVPSPPSPHVSAEQGLRKERERRGPRVTGQLPRRAGWPRAGGQEPPPRAQPRQAETQRRQPGVQAPLRHSKVGITVQNCRDDG